MLSIAMLPELLTALVGTAVFLQAAVRLVCNGHLNQAVCQGRFEITFAEGCAVYQAEGGL